MTEKELRYKLKDYPNVVHNMLEHIVFHDFLSKATEEQLGFCEDFFNEEVLLLTNNSRAGTAKTYTSVLCAYADYLNHGKEFVFVMSPVEENSIGFRPGKTDEKSLDYFAPLHDALLELNLNPEQVVKNLIELDPKATEDKKSEAFVTSVLHTFLRGTNIKDKTVILSESQNFTRGEMKKVLTRIHDSCTTIVEGHTLQTDIKVNKSGFEPYIEHLKKADFARHHEFTKNFRGRVANYCDQLEW